jgi:RHS repeat-associated protein
VFTYDANGNTLSDGLRSYEWDAENRLARVRHGDGSATAFGYDGRGRRVWIEEKDALGTVTSVRRYVWAGGTQPTEERDGSNTVLRRFYPEGEQAPGAAGPLDRLFYAKDHLGSVREVTDAAGVLRARYDYGFWGNRTRVSGDVETAVGYTGHHHHGKSALVLTWYRAYDPDTGRWLSRDPLKNAEFKQGSNLYAYVESQPVTKRDPKGLQSWGPPFMPPPQRADQSCLGAIIEAWATTGIGNNYPGLLPQYPGVTDDKYQHCVSSCKLTRACGAGIAEFLGDLKEARDQWFGEGADFRDYQANEKGRSIGADCKDKRSCEDACR